MIESCSKKKMIIAIVCLIGLSIFVVVIENFLTPNSQTQHKSSGDQMSSNISIPENCWQRETFKELEECQPCSDLEMNSQSPLACTVGFYRQKIECVKTGVVYRRCDRAVWLEERHYFIFILCNAIIAAFGYSYTGHRQHSIQERVLRRINQQLSAGV